MDPINGPRSISHLSDLYRSDLSRPIAVRRRGKVRLRLAQESGGRPSTVRYMYAISADVRLSVFSLRFLPNREGLEPRSLTPPSRSDPRESPAAAGDVSPNYGSFLLVLVSILLLGLFLRFGGFDFSFGKGIRIVAVICSIRAWSCDLILTKLIRILLRVTWMHELELISWGYLQGETTIWLEAGWNIVIWRGSEYWFYDLDACCSRGQIFLGNSHERSLIARIALLFGLF